MEGLTRDEKKEFYRRFSELDKGITRILGILESDDTIKKRGLAETVKIMGNDLSELLTREKVYKAKATTWGIVGGAVGTALVWGAKILITKIPF